MHVFFWGPYCQNFISKLMLTFATDISATTVYSLNVLVPMKWYKVFPLHEKRDVPSGITPLPCVPLQISRKEMMIYHSINHKNPFT